MKKLFILGAAGAAFVSLSACGSADNQEEQGSESEEKLEVYTTLFAWEDFTKQIGGDHVNVENVVPAGSDAHTYDPTPQTLTNIAEGDVFVMTGNGMEGFADEVESTIGDQDVQIARVAEAAGGEEAHDHEEGESEEEHAEHTEESHSGEEVHDHEEGESEEEHAEHAEESHSGEEHDHSGTDPHVWIDPVQAKEAAGVIKDQLIEADPDNEQTYENNYEELAAELDELDDRFETLVDESSKNQFIVSHAAYGYWEERYGLEEIAVNGVNAQDEPSTQEINDIIDKAEQNDLNAIMVEENIPSDTTDVLQEEIGAEVYTLNNLESASEEEIADGASYVSLMNQNIDNLEKALNE
ncbi:metal ABC transporter solute-binding protein, Zn/Mn family [Marinococcus luteus]|uniref:metal ABC transporter solute-binding protein, Zn/Mn family n=1 Tax=Marinococcus luteus TaxID=1122204 RepID=UPI002ACCE53C|nr:zinc ABC transporter substrate-binding protein [Marinococcus luteus]MDZ5783039.1 zinc ABC transporter substrate-binding protein [Marinococcus luteus]